MSESQLHTDVHPPSGAVDGEAADVTDETSGLADEPAGTDDEVAAAGEDVAEGVAVLVSRRWRRTAW